jgi:uncharacterized membrane protein YkvA (DUF1232 family)
MFEKLKALNETIQHEFKVYQLVLQDERTPLFSKIMLGLAVGYMFLPFDLLPDFLPVIGQLDDVLIVPLLVVLALRFIPAEVMEDCRSLAGWHWGDYLR